jgi:hypothetical protein
MVCAGGRTCSKQVTSYLRTTSQIPRSAQGLWLAAGGSRSGLRFFGGCPVLVLYPDAELSIAISCARPIAVLRAKWRAYEYLVCGTSQSRCDAEARRGGGGLGK